jgi:hypothetical protein
MRQVGRQVGRKAQAPRQHPGRAQLLAWVKELEELLQFPTVEGHVEASTRLATAIARSTDDGAIANLAMKVLSEVNALRNTALPLKPDRAGLNKVLWHLRLAVEERFSTVPR